MLLKSGTQYGRLSYIGDSVIVNERSTKKLLFKCDCGKDKMMAFRNVVLGLSRSCGKCSERLIKTGHVFGSLTWIDDDAYVQPESQKKHMFRCACGRVKAMRLFTVLRGRAKTCGDCHLTSLRHGDKVHRFTYAGDDTTVHAGGSKALAFTCECGKTVNRRLKSIGPLSTCGKCGYISLQAGQVYGNFTYDGKPLSIGPWSKRELPFICRCGNRKNLPICLITSGDVVSCTECYARVLSWFQANQPALKQLKCPVQPSQVPVGVFKPLEVIRSVSKPFKALCPACGRTYGPRLTDLKRLKCITCGCVNNVVSAPNCEIAEFVRSLGHEAIQEYAMDGKVFDICVPSAGLLIELQGIRWHSKPDSRKRDMAKYLAAVASGHKTLWIFEDEWRRRRSVCEAIIAARLGCSRAARLRPSSCEIRSTSNSEANALYDSFHYIGRCASSFSYGAYVDGRLVAAMSFRKPSRQSAYDLEMSRMVSDPAFRIHGIWSKLMLRLQREHPGVSVVAYSDNRLFDGGVYRVMGFRLDGDVKPDYYWARGDNRFHKSALRKPPKCAVTETALRESQGYRKIWDLGKKRWVLKV